MNTYWTEPVILSREQFRQLSDSLCRPDKEYMDRRNALFAANNLQILQLHHPIAHMIFHL